MKKKSILSLIISSLVIGLVGCGGSSYKSDAAATATAYAEEEAAEYYSDDLYEFNEADFEAMKEAGEGSENVEVSENTNRKIIKTVNINAETEEFDTFISTVSAKVDSLGGYLESTDISGRSFRDDSYLRYANLTARIPSKRLNDFVSHITENSNITNKSESAEDVTLNYADTEARISSLRTEQQRLNELMAQAQDIDTIITLEQRITEVRYEIESFESQLRTLDNKVDYSTVYLNVNEVRKYTPVVTEPQSFGQRVAEGFAESLSNVCEGVVDFIAELIIALPYIFVFIVFLAIIVLIAFLFIRILIRIIKKADEKSAKKRQEEIRKAEERHQKELKKAQEANVNAPVDNGENK